MMYSPRLLYCLCLSGCMLAPSFGATAEPLIERHSSGWRYHDAPQTAGAALENGQWRAADFDDAGWRTGRGLLGYGDADISTELSFGEHPQQKRPAAFFRRRFRVSQANRFRLFGGRICCDDGAVVWLNGREVFRGNMPSGNVTAQTHAVRAIGPGAETERRYQGFEIAGDAVLEGENVVAVSVHQATPTSSDLAMDFELVGFESDEETEAFRVELQAETQEETPSTEPSLSITPVVQIGLATESE